MDSGYDGSRLAHVLADLPVEIVVRIRADRVMLRDPGPPRSTPRGGRPRRHGGVLTLAKPDTWHTPHATTSTVTTRYGRADALAWDRMHPCLQRRGPWPEYTNAELPVLHGGVERLCGQLVRGHRSPPESIGPSRAACADSRTSGASGSSRSWIRRVRAAGASGTSADAAR